MNKRIKRGVAVIAILLLSTMSVFGTDGFSGGIGTKAENYISAVATISVTDTTAKATARITGKPGTIGTTIHMYVQRYSDGKWINVRDWKESSNSKSQTLSKSISVTKGRKYRTKAVFWAYVGSKEEKTTKYSQTVTV